MSPPEIPVIDIGGLRSEDLHDRRSVAAKIRQACHEIGFFYIINHGIADDVSIRLLAETQRFFALPLPVKNQVSMTFSEALRGYEPIGAETLDPDAVPDWKESFHIGIDRSADDPLVQAKTPHHGTNQWVENLSGWKSTLEDYFAIMMQLSHQLIRGIALSLDLDEYYFAPFIDNPMAILRLLHYPPHPSHAPKNQLGCGAHIDWSLFTVLLQDQCSGLEMYHPSGQWLSVKPIAGTFIFNLGDLLSRWTNDFYRAAPHRVLNCSDRDRYSLPFFFDINYHALVQCLPTCQSSENPPQYPAFVAGEHIIKRYQQSYRSLVDAA